MKIIKFCLVLIIIIAAFSSCAVQPARSRVVVVHKKRPAKVIVVKPVHRRNVVVMKGARI